MHRFYTKYAKELGDKAAIRAVVDKTEEALGKHMENEKSDDYLYELAKVNEMLNDIFTIKGVSPKDYLRV